MEGCEEGVKDIIEKRKDALDEEDEIRLRRDGFGVVKGKEQETKDDLEVKDHDTVPSFVLAHFLHDPATSVDKELGLGHSIDFISVDRRKDKVFEEMMHKERRMALFFLQRSLELWRWKGTLTQSLVFSFFFGSVCEAFKGNVWTDLCGQRGWHDESGAALLLLLQSFHQELASPIHSTSLFLRRPGHPSSHHILGRSEHPLLPAIQKRL